jgi:hypothetical protein
MKLGILDPDCKFRISNIKKDIEKFLKDGILDLEAVELKKTESKIRVINLAYSQDLLYV